jgi:hypothetical protein
LLRYSDVHEFHLLILVTAIACRSQRPHAFAESRTIALLNRFLHSGQDDGEERFGRLRASGTPFESIFDGRSNLLDLI